MEHSSISNRPESQPLPSRNHLQLLEIGRFDRFTISSVSHRTFNCVRLLYLVGSSGAECSAFRFRDSFGVLRGSR